MSVIVEWVRRSGFSSSNEVCFCSSCETIPEEALIPNMRRIRATATRTWVLIWKNMFPTIFRSGLILPPLPSAYLYLMPTLYRNWRFSEHRGAHAFSSRKRSVYFDPRKAVGFLSVNHSLFSSRSASIWFSICSSAISW